MYIKKFQKSYLFQVFASINWFESGAEVKEEERFLIWNMAWQKMCSHFVDSAWTNHWHSSTVLGELPKGMDPKKLEEEESFACHPPKYVWVRGEVRSSSCNFLVYSKRDLKINTFLQQMYKCVWGFLTLSLIKAQKCAENDMRITVTNYKEQEEPKFSYSKS